jgi:hypothetical protein
MNRFFSYNALVTATFLVVSLITWKLGLTFGTSASRAFLFSPFVGSYAVSLVTLHQRFPKSAFALSFLSASVWWVATMIVFVLIAAAGDGIRF